MFAATRGECSTNKTHKNPNDNPKKILINQIKLPPTLPTFKIPLKIQKFHTIEISIVNFFINKTTINQKATKISPL